MTDTDSTSITSTSMMWDSSDTAHGSSSSAQAQTETDIRAELLGGVEALADAVVEAISSAGSPQVVVVGPADIQDHSDDLLPQGGTNGLVTSFSAGAATRGLVVVEDQLHASLAEIPTVSDDVPSSTAWLSVISEPIERWARTQGAIIESAIPLEGVRQVHELFGGERMVIAAAGLFIEGIHVGSVALTGFERPDADEHSTPMLGASTGLGVGTGTALAPPAERPSSSGIDGQSVHALSRLADVEMTVTVELGRKRMSVSELLSLAPGSLIELDRAAGSPVDLLVNNSLVAKGEVVVIDDEYGVRITDIVGSGS